MDRVTISLLSLLILRGTHTLPIKNGFSVKFKPISTKEEMIPRTFGALFAKISQDFSPDADMRRELLSKTISSPTPLGMGCTNQVARVIFPYKYFQKKFNETLFFDGMRLMDPTVRQPIHDYKVLVATAPPNVRMGRGDDGKKIIVYIVFPEDTEDIKDEANFKIPEVYFVTKQEGTTEPEARKERTEPLLLIDSNRTVTGLRSKHVAKFLRFKNHRLNTLNRYAYDVDR